MKNFKNFLFVSIFITSLIFAKNYKGAEYRTHDTFTYGRFEVCYKSSQGPGQTSTFFTYHELGEEGSSAWNEIDVEILGRYRNDVQFNPITPGQEGHEYHCYVDFDPAEGYHVYAFEWTPGYVAWFIDGVEMHRQTGEHIESLNRGQKIMLNIWPPVYENWVGLLDPACLPLFAYYDWISYSTYTPDSGNTGTENNFTFQWKDDLDSCNQNRWGKASHTFSGNNCQFLPDNIVFRDGKLILCLTDNENTGFVDKNPPVPQLAWYDGEVIKIRFSEEVEKYSSENLSNYILRNGGVISSITLGEYKREVTLEVSGYDASIAHDFLIINIKDLSATPNTSGPKFIDVANPPEYDYPLKINVGGEATEDFLADQDWDFFETDWGHVSGTPGSTENPIENTDLDVVYQNEINNFVAYKVRVPKGIYDVTLMFSENDFSEAGKRIIDINLEGTYVAENLDVFAEVGKNYAYNILTENIAFLHGIVINQISTVGTIDEINKPKKINLNQNYPNPFNGSTTIKYELKEDSFTNLSIFDISGNKVSSLVNDFQNSGEYRINWTPNVASGVYFIQLKAQNICQIKKILYLK